MSALGRLVFPAVRWRDGSFDHASADIDAALAAGVGGFCIFGGTVPAVQALTAELRERSRTPLLFASDLERGAGQQFAGATQLPPLAAIGALDDVSVTRRAAALTAAEALQAGIDWIYAPVADTDLEPRNPIVGTRAFGTDPDHVARHVAAWVDGCRSVGALCCAKHFPGHGRTTADSHAELPRVTNAAAELAADLRPFDAAIRAGVDSMMTAHVLFDAYDDATAATFSAPILTDLARRQLGFRGLLVSDALNMAGSRDTAGGEGAAAVAALRAGCDGLLYPDDLGAVLPALERARGRDVSADRCVEALARVAAAAERMQARRAAPAEGGNDPRVGVRAWADDIAERSLVLCRGEPRLAGAAGVATIDDDTGGPFAPPARTTFTDTLRAAGVGVRADDAPPLIAVYSDIRAWKGPPGLRPAARARLDALLAAHPDATVVLFGHPRLTATIPARHVLAAWGGEAIMQRAAARRLLAGLRS